MSAVGAHETAHAHLRSALEQALGDEAICPRDGLQRAGDGEHTIVHTLDDLADAGTHARLVAQVGHVLACLANDDAGLLGRDNGAQCQLRLLVFFLGARCDVAVVTEPCTVHRAGDLADVL